MKSIFITDDNMVLNPKCVKKLCDAIIARNYKNLKLHVQADCLSMVARDDMVEKMAAAGFKSVFLGIENGSKKNLSAVGKGDIVWASKRAIDNCHKYGMTKSPLKRIMPFSGKLGRMPHTVRSLHLTRKPGYVMSSWGRISSAIQMI